RNCEADIREVEIGVLRHVEIRRVALRNSCPDCIREAVVRLIPRAMIGGDGAMDRIGLEVRDRLAALAELRDLPGRNGDVGAWREHRGGNGSALGEQARQSNT